MWMLIFSIGDINANGERSFICLIYLQHALIVNLVEDCAVDLIGLQSRPVKYRQAELGLDGLLDSDSCGQEANR